MSEQALTETAGKFASSKEVIAFLAETYPQCFSVSGDAKPLKIGIFQDLASQLEGEQRLSKTLLRASLRHYTNSWRYLYAVKEGAQRVDLTGETQAVVDKEHAEHAQKQLQESKQRAAERRKQQGDKKASEGRKNTNGAKADDKKSYKTKVVKVPRAKVKKRVAENKRETKREATPAIIKEPVSSGSLNVGTEVSVKVGKAPMLATVTEVVKDDVQVQLASGMVLKVKVDKLRLVQPKG